MFFFLILDEFEVTGELLGLWDLFTGNVENDETLARSSTIEEPAEKEAAPSSPIEEPKQFNFSDDFLVFFPFFFFCIQIEQLIFC